MSQDERIGNEMIFDYRTEVPITQYLVTDRALLGLVVSTSATFGGDISWLPCVLPVSQQFLFCRL